jgi:ATP-dependent DNA helicase RecQ
VLVGNESEKVRKFGHETLVCFGQGSAHKREEWQSLIRQLAAAGFIDIDASGYGSLTVGAQGRALLRGGTTFKHRPTRPTKKVERKARQQAETAGFSDDQQSLLAALKQLRWQLAQQRQVAAYLIFSDRTLIDMAYKKPRTVEAFAQVHGVGAAKLQQFAGAFLSAIEQHGQRGAA